MNEAILRFFAGLPLQGSGSDLDTVRVLHTFTDALPAGPAVADFGCGTGRSSLALAQALPDARITGLDAEPVFIDALREWAARLGLSGQVRASVGDVLAPGLAPGSLDLVWSEGAAYAVGFPAALQAWRPLLRDTGRCVVSECEWLSDMRPPPIVQFWRENYSGMGTRAENLDRARQAGFDVLGIYVLSDAGWNDYYGALASTLAGMPAGAIPCWFADGIVREISIRTRAEGCFGYVFYVLRLYNP